MPILAGLAAAVWLVVSYAVPASLMLIRDRSPVLGAVNGAWLLWVGATQSLAVAAAFVARLGRGFAMPR